ncbi:MAG: BspA family leucine-rich repeat surface protein [Dyadobacter sp.]|uniref:BspA family leucine-rich repeat surface protein n=1 Tax=Dyadobacter sp. TaxID=1914288 RepID=UPI00326716B7
MKTFYILLLTLMSQLTIAQNFITRWNLATAGSGNTQLTFGVATTGTVNYTWQEVSPGAASGSGTFTGSTATITGLPAGSITELSITPTNFSEFNINGGPDINRLIDVSQWGTTAWTSMNTAFRGCHKLQISANDLPNLGSVTSMIGMFIGCTSLNGPANIGEWNMSNVTDMKEMFYGANAFNQPIGNWNTGNVTSMRRMFYNAYAFNQPIGNWNTGNVTDLSYMFFHADAFNQPIGNWNTGNVTDMSYLFFGATAFNQPIGIWDTGKVTDMSYMFLGANDFNQSIGNWNTGKVFDMYEMFYGATAFNQPIGNWNTGNVIDMSGMFYKAAAFNQPTGIWDTGKVTNMASMFEGATAFNQPIGNWNTAKVTDMNGMFDGATAFNQPIGNWNTANVTDMVFMFDVATAFNQPIGNWNTSKVRYMRMMFHGATAFNQPVGNWNTAKVESMYGMFFGATAFNQPIGNWNTGNVTYMTGMFESATAFNQPIGNWNTANVTDMSYMFNSASMFNKSLGTWILNAKVDLSQVFTGSGLDCDHYSATLIGWSANPATPGGRLLGANGRSYGTNAVAARNNLITAKGWTIVGDAASNTDCSAALPVTLVFFSGKKTAENQNALKWITADEKNFDRFEIQRSSDARSFETIGIVLGQTGNGEAVHGGTLNAYNFTDPTPGPSNYYRLKMVDRSTGTPEQDHRDAPFAYSRIISMENSSENAVVGNFYPNPSNEKVFVDVYAVESGSWTLTIINAGGKTIGTQVHDLQKGMNKVSLNQVPPGITLVRFEQGLFSEVRKLIRE